jgi:hypothetical protein
MRQSGRLFFGDFLLAAQKKVTRLSVREPTLKKRLLRLLKKPLKASLIIFDKKMSVFSVSSLDNYF